MAHHLFLDVAVLEHPATDNFYGSGILSSEPVQCSRTYKRKLISTKDGKEIQSKMIYLFPIDTNVSPSDIVDGSEVLDVREFRGVSLSYKEVLT
jgi:hypothetical protein